MKCWPLCRTRSIAADRTPAEQTPAYWSRPLEALCLSLDSGPDGLTATQAAERLLQDGPNRLEAQSHTSAWGLLFSQFKSPLVVILIVAAIISMLAGEWIDASVVLAIVLGSTMLGFAQEFIAGSAIDKLRSQVQIHSSVLRDCAMAMSACCLRTPLCVAMWCCCRQAA